MYTRRGYRLFKPQYDRIMIRDQVGETAYGNAVRKNTSVLRLKLTLRDIFTSFMFACSVCSIWKSK